MRVTEFLQYIGPGRRSSKTVIEWQLQCSAAELESFQAAATAGFPGFRELLDQSGIRPGEDLFIARDPIRQIAGLVSCIALQVQQLAGHRVSDSGFLPSEQAGCCRLFFEYEHASTGIDAGELAMRLLAETIPGLEWSPDEDVPGEDFSKALSLFMERSPAYVLPLDTQAIIEAAARLDIPSVKLERDPYDEVPGDYRIRRNGLLKLGHCRFLSVVDGTLSVERNAALIPLLFDREELYKRMLRLQLPVPGQDRELHHLLSAKRASRAAQRVGFPVVLKPAARSRPRHYGAENNYAPLHSVEQVRAEFDRVSAAGQKVVVEQYIEGATFHVLVANHDAICTVAAASGQVLESPVDPSILEMAIRVSRALNCGLLCLSLVSSDPSRPLAETGGAVVDIDFAPQLESLLPQGSEILGRAAESFVRWLYPEGAASRIPLIAVTGTNGKTTTSKMIAQIMQQAGQSTGLAMTHGVVVNGELLQKGDMSGRAGHHRLFESREVEMGVLEAARGAVANSGFMFDWCDVAVCTNVSADHLGEYDVDTLDQMVELKRSIVERARQAVVLNADYATCRSMLPFDKGQTVYLASLQADLDEIRSLSDGPVCACLVEQHEGANWLVLYEQDGNRLPVMPVTSIPATLDGAARFNTSNAQHAICACHAMDVHPDVIRKVLSGFDSSFENSPGRLNVYRELPFTVIMDYAHNEDGMKQLISVLEQWKVKGRKILLFAVSYNRTDEGVAETTRSALGYFDHFLCRCYPGRFSTLRPEIPGLMKASLMQAGIEEKCITEVADPEQGTQQALGLARPGDLVVLCPGTAEIDRMWQEITSFEPVQPVKRKWWPLGRFRS